MRNSITKRSRMIDLCLISSEIDVCHKMLMPSLSNQLIVNHTEFSSEYIFIKKKK